MLSKILSTLIELFSQFLQISSIVLRADSGRANPALTRVLYDKSVSLAKLKLKSACCFKSVPKL
ncbi:Uncharacterised protein [Chlamydia trachomatis]|nr:Uncharacterised protein [Chlamydia trachomatis]